MTKFVQSKEVAWNFLGEKIIAFNLSGEKQFHDLNETAAVIFRTMQVPVTEAELVEAVLAEFEVSEDEARTDVATLLTEMRQKRLVTEA